MDKRKFFVIILTFGFYVFGASISYMLFSSSLFASKTILIAPPTKSANGALSFDQTLPKTESCPLNGAMYSKQQLSWWEKHRPLGVMIENHTESRPQSGISFADVVYEAIAEGGITRFLTVFYCQDAPQVGPVRSARDYFIDFLSEYADYPLYAHVGGANADGPADALGHISDYGWVGYNDLNQFSIGFPTFWRDYDRLGHDVATEHTMYSTTSKLWAVGVTRGLTNTDKDGNTWDKSFVEYGFKNDVDLVNRPIAQALHLEFWEGNTPYDVDWNYTKDTNEYKRSNGGIAHLDRDTNKQLTTKNVVVLFMKESHADDGYENNVHLLYQNKGTGKAEIFQDGKEIKGTWKKTSRTARTLLYDSAGKAIEFNRGKIWFEILPLDGVMQVK